MRTTTRAWGARAPVVGLGLAGCMGSALGQTQMGTLVVRKPPDVAHYTPCPAGPFQKVAVGMWGGCLGIRPDGTLFGWYPLPEMGTFPQVPGTFIDVAGGVNYSCAIREDGTLFEWGQLPNGQTAPSGLYKKIDISSPWAIGIRQDGTLIVWGDTTYINYPLFGDVKIVPPGKFKDVAAGYLHAVGIREDGQVVVWGYKGGGGARRPPGYLPSSRSP